MMIGAGSDRPPADGWTSDDLDALPDDRVRRELLDGTFTDAIKIDEPWRIEIPIAGLRPRNL
jgi:hypothetical protein